MLVLDDGLLDGAPTDPIATDTAADDPAQLYYTSGTTGLAKGIVHAHRYLLAHEEFVYCHEVQDGERFHGMGEWAWAAGIAPLLGPWRLGAVQCVYQREGGFDPHKQLDFLVAPRGHQRLHDADGDALDDGDRRRGHALPAAVPHRLHRRASRSTPRRSAGSASSTALTVLDYYGLTESYPLCANFPFMDVREGSMGKPMPGWDVQILDEDEQPVAQGERGEICLRARSNPHWPLGYWNNDEASRGDLRRRVVPHQGRRRRRTRTATSGTRVAPTT